MAEEQTEPNGRWQHIATALDNKISLMEEPTDIRLEYRVRAVNKGARAPHQIPFL